MNQHEIDELRARVADFLESKPKRGKMVQLVGESGITRQTITAFLGSATEPMPATVEALQAAMDRIAPKRPSNYSNDDLGNLIYAAISELDGLLAALKSPLQSNEAKARKLFAWVEVTYGDLDFMRKIAKGGANKRHGNNAF